MKKTLTKLLLATTSIISLISIAACSDGKNTFTITFDSAGGTPIESQVVKKGEHVSEPDDPEKYGYNFAKWVDIETHKKWDFDLIVTKDMTLSARYTRGEFKATVSTDRNIAYATIGTSEYLWDEKNEETFEYEQDVYIKAVSYKGYKFKSWIDTKTQTVISTDIACSIKMPGEEMSLYAEFEIDSNYVEFGTYPQRKVSDETLIDTLNEKVGHNPEQDLNGWNAYPYYSNNIREDYQWYVDVEDNGVKYRGVYATKNRPENQGNTATSVDEESRKISWYTFGPVVWRIMNDENGQKLLICGKIIDSQPYQIPDTSYGSSKGAVWSGSYVQSFLNNEFFNTCFNESEKAKILSKAFDDLDDSDKVFILSSNELTEEYGFIKSTSENYIKDINNNYYIPYTEYAYAQKLYGNCGSSDNLNRYVAWILRDPDYYSYRSNQVVYDSIGWEDVDDVDGGLVPVIKITY